MRKEPAERDRTEIGKGMLCEISRVLRRDKNVCVFIAQVKDDHPYGLVCTLTRKKLYLVSKIQEGAKVYLSGEVKLREYRDKFGQVHYENVFYVSEI